LPREAPSRSRPATNRWLKLVLCLCFLLIAAALLLIDRYSPATGYELSIYSSLPAAAWICLIGALAGGTAIVVHQAFAGSRSRYWLLAFILLLFVTCIALLLPVFKGYYLYGSADTGGHIKWAGEIVARGRFWEGDQYPVTHILIAQLTQASGISSNMIGKGIPAFFSLLFTIFSYLLASSVMPKKGPALLTAASVALFFNYYHVCVYPQILSIMMLPLLFYLYFKSSGHASTPFRVGFVTLLFLFPYFHPAPAAVLVASLLGAEIARAAWKIREPKSIATVEDATERISLEPTLIASVAFLTWISAQGIFAKTIWNTLGWLAGEIETIPRVDEVENLFQTAGLSVGDQVVLALKMYGDNLVYLSLSMVALLIIARASLAKRTEVKSLSILSIPFLVSGPVWVLIFAITLQVTMGRLLGSNVMMWAMPVFAAFGLYQLFAKWKTGGFVTVTGILVVASAIGGLGVYHSPYILQGSWHVTEQDVLGTEWFLTRAHTQSQRKEYANLGVPFMSPGRVYIPDHFGYHRQQTLGGSLNQDALFVLTERTKQTVMDPLLQKHRISDPRIKLVATDFQRLEQDATVSRLYSAGEFEVLRVAGHGET